MPPSVKPKSLSTEALAVLERAEYHNLPLPKPHIIVLPPGLTRPLYDEVNKALEALGGKWNRKAKGHEFAADPRERLDQVLQSGGFVDQDKILAFFPTPAAIADRIVQIADIYPGMSVLEPSAGEGAIVEALTRPQNGRDAMLHDVAIDLVEIDPGRAASLRRFRVPVACADFLDIGTVLQPDGNRLCRPGKLYQRIIGNPPWSVPGRPQADIDHMEHACKMLAPGGRLVMIGSAGISYRMNAKASAFRDFIRSRGGSIELLPAGAFSESGTEMAAAIVVVNG